MDKHDIEQAPSDADVEPVVSPETAEPAPIAESLDRDQRLAAIKDELIAQWEQKHGSRYNADSNLLSAKFQDFLFGDPAEQRRGQEPKSLDDRARELFTQRFAADAKTYTERERARVYEHPTDDPAVRAVEDNIVRTVNAEVAGAAAGKQGSIAAAESADYPSAWGSTFSRVARQEWADFATNFPEKAAAYEARLKAAAETPAAAEPNPNETAPPTPIELTLADAVEDAQQRAQLRAELGQPADEVTDQARGQEAFTILSTLQEPHHFEVDAATPALQRFEVLPADGVVAVSASDVRGGVQRWEVAADGSASLDEWGPDDSEDEGVQQQAARRKQGAEALVRLEALLNKFRAEVRRRQGKQRKPR